VSGVAGSHHVLGVKHLLGELWDGEGSVLLATSAGQGGKSWHEEVQTWEWHHVDCEFPQVSVQLTRESQTGSDTGHSGRDKVIEIAVCWGCELEGSETDIVQGFIVNTVGFICVFY